MLASRNIVTTPMFKLSIFKDFWSGHDLFWSNVEQVLIVHRFCSGLILKKHFGFNLFPSKLLIIYSTLIFTTCWAPDTCYLLTYVMLHMLSGCYLTQGFNVARYFYFAYDKPKTCTQVKTAPFLWRFFTSEHISRQKGCNTAIAIQWCNSYAKRLS